jgi:hypothetical protein
MFQLEKINDLFSCKICKDVLVDPIFLPCGETVCKAHTDEIRKDKCMLCSGAHIVSKEGFPENRIVKNLLENKISLNFSQFDEYNKIIQDLSKNLKEIELIRNDPVNYISEYFGELTRQVDLRRETLIKDINTYSDVLIQKIEKLKQECEAKSKNAVETSENMFSKKKSKEMSDLMGAVLKQYKFELQGKKYYKLLTNKIKMENVFGSLGCFDFDIDNMKVNIAYLLQLSFL